MQCIKLLEVMEQSLTLQIINDNDVCYLVMMKTL